MSNSGRLHRPANADQGQTRPPVLGPLPRTPFGTKPAGVILPRRGLKSQLTPEVWSLREPNKLSSLMRTFALVFALIVGVATAFMPTPAHSPRLVRV